MFRIGPATTVIRSTPQKIHFFHLPYSPMGTEKSLFGSLFLFDCKLSFVRVKEFFFTRCFHDTLLCACVWVRFFFDICWYHCSNGRRNQNCCKIHRLRLWFWHWDNFTQRHSGRRILWSEHQYMSALMWYIYQQNQQFEKITFDLHADCHLLYIDDRFWF